MKEREWRRESLRILQECVLKIGSTQCIGVLHGLITLCIPDVPGGTTAILLKRHSAMHASPSEPVQLAVKSPWHYTRSVEQAFLGLEVRRQRRGGFAIIEHL